jgi:GNAT superfamily N-acetyltransferase
MINIKKYKTNLYISKSDIEGEGLFSKTHININKIICQIADLYKVDSTENWINEWGHKINHSINPTAKVIIVGNKCFIKAINDIKVGEEITTDYRTIPDFFNKGIYENTNSKITFSNEVTNSYSGQINCEAGVYENGDIMGYVQYVLYDNELTISDIFVRPDRRRERFGSMLVDYIKKLNPKYKYIPSMMTDLGAKFIHK